jgi:RNA polymerase sigma-B factor
MTRESAVGLRDGESIRREPSPLEPEAHRFRRWQTTRDPALRDQIIHEHHNIAVGLAKRFRGRGAELDDLIQVAQIGLLLAVDRFDPDRGVPFLGFATPTILGELRRHFRTVWSVKMPRGLQEASQRIGPAFGDLHQELCRSPTIDEVAKRVGMSAEAVLEAIEAASAFRTVSLDAPSRSSVGSNVGINSRLQSVDVENSYDRVVARETVERLLPLLSKRSRQIVELRFFEERSQLEIAEIVGVSQMHVSRLLRQALEHFARVIENDEVGNDPEQ